MMEVMSVLALLSVVAFVSVRASAAPHRNRATTERSRRATNEENELWANPCDYADGSSHQTTHRPIQEIASKLAKAALWAYKNAYSYSEKFAKLHSYPNFSAELQDFWKSEAWLIAEGLPEWKADINEKLPQNYIEEVVASINAKLPSMYMALKMVVAGLYRLSEELGNDHVSERAILKENIAQTMHDVRAVLCYCNDLMHALNLEIRPLLDKDMPSFANDFGLLLYRDTLNYMDYLHQVFSKLAEMVSTGAVVIEVNGVI